MEGPPDIDTAMAWRGRAVRDQDGNELGTLGELYLDSETSRPAWAGITRGRLRRTETVVPLEGVQEDGEDLRLPLDLARFDEAPDIDPEVELTAEQERVLYEHYGREWRTPPAPAAGDSPSPAAGDDGTEMVRSEEEISVHKQPVETERVRLKKRVVTDQVEKTVPVRKEVVQLETEPPPEGEIESVEEVDEPPAR